MNNVFVRFIYEATFELLICAFINISSLSATSGSKFWWITSLFVICALVLATLLLISQFCFSGPYIHCTYAPGTFIESLWGARPLHGDIIRQALKPKKATKETAKVIDHEDSPNKEIIIDAR